jgi:two-component system sensor histidine kinase TctE
MVLVSERRPSLQWRLIGSLSVALTLGSTVLGFAAYNYAQTAADDSYDRLLIGAAEQISETVSADNGRVTVDVPLSALETLSISRSDRVYYRVDGPDGAAVTGYDDLPRPLVAEGSEAPAVGDAAFKGAAIRIASVKRYVSEAGINGWVVTTVGQTREARNALSRDLTTKAVILVAAMSLIALIGIMIAVRRALRPLLTVEAALLGRDPNNLTPLNVEAPAEIAELVDVINRFMQRLSDRFDVMQRYIADSAHQLRTPLTALAAQVELLANEDRPAQQKGYLTRLRERTAELGRLTNQLLSHAMVSHRAQAMAADQVDLGAIARQAVADAIPVSLERDIAVRQEIGAEPVLIQGDAVSLREAIRNVVENAVHHGAHEGLWVRVTREADGALVEVHDDGPGIPEAEWPRAAERFYRGKTQAVGSGLGLSIAADVAKSHDAEMSFERPQSGGFTVRFRFPGQGTRA